MLVKAGGQVKAAVSASQPAMVRIVLHGLLGATFGREFKLLVHSAAHAIRLLEANFPGKFFTYIRDKGYHVVRGPGEWTSGRDMAVHPAMMAVGLGEDTLHIVPAVVGASKTSKGLFGIIIGTVLIGAALALSGGTLAAPIFAGFSSLTWGTLATIGAGLAIGGALTLLSPVQKTTDNKPGTFSGPNNTAKQGVPVPVVYGRAIAGTVTIYGGIFTTALGNKNKDAGPDQGFG